MLAPRIGAWTPLGTALAAAVFLLGCVKRQEAIEVQPDGSANLTVVFEGDLDDVRQGDAMLNEPGPWTVQDETETDKEGKQTLTRTARLHVPAAGRFPTQYCEPQAELSPLATSFDTVIRTENRPDGLYYHFQRTYQPRRWAWIEHYRRAFVEPVTKKLHENGEDFTDLNPDQRRELAVALLAFEAAKVQAFADAAIQQVQPPLRQDERLAIHQAIGAAYASVGPDRVVNILTMEDPDELHEAIETQVALVFEDIERRIIDVLHAGDPTDRLANGLLDRFEQEKRRFAITEDLQDETWEVRITLPGRLVGHNGGEIKDGAAYWEFEGNALCDREVVLLATSVVERAK